MNKIEENYDVYSEDKKDVRKKLSKKYNKKSNKEGKSLKTKLTPSKVFKYFLLFILFSFVLYNNIYQFTISRSIFKKNIFNIRLYHVTENTMEDSLKKGDISVISTRKTDYKEGDIVLLQDQSGVKLERIMSILEKSNENSKVQYATKADNSYYYNNFVIEDSMIVGKQSFKIPKAGWLLEIARSRVSTIVMIAVLIVILFFLFQIRLYKPVRSTEDNKKISLFKKLKFILTRKDKEMASKKAKHSRKIQKEKTKKRIEARRNKKEKN